MPEHSPSQPRNDAASRSVRPRLPFFHVLKTWAVVAAVVCVPCTLLFGQSQPQTTQEIGSTVTLTSNHHTHRAGENPDARYDVQTWHGQAIKSPSGKWTEEDTYNGLDRADGEANKTVTLDEVGVWELHQSEGYDAAPAGSTQSYILRTINVINKPTTFTLTIVERGAGNHTVSGAGTYPAGESVTVGATWDGTSTVFNGFSGAVSGAGPSIVVTMDNDKTVIADFDRKTVTLSLSAKGRGTVEGGGSFKYGDTATAMAIDGLDVFSRFTGAVSGASSDLGGGRHSTTVLMDSDKALVAMFDPVPDEEFKLSIDIVGNGMVSGAGKHLADSSVEVTATPGDDSEFAGFSGDLTGTQNPQTLVMDRDKAITATFTKKAVTVTVEKFTLTTNAAGSGTVSGSGSYDKGQQVLVSASWNSDTAVFDGFSGDLSGTATPQWITMDSNKVVIGNFSAKPDNTTFPVTITISGPGNVSGDGDHPQGSSVWVTASWDSSTASFIGYSGDLNGSNPAQLLFVDGAKNITATFEALAPTAPPGTGTIMVRSFDKQNRLRTMIGVPYVVTYSTSGAGLFSITRGGTTLKSDASGSGKFNQHPSQVGSETIALMWSAKSGDPWVQIADATITVVSGPTATIRDLPSTVTAWPNPAPATVQLQDLYPGAFTWVQLTDSDGKTWKSAPAIGVSSAEISLTLSEILKYFRRTNNSVQIQVFSDNAVSGWQAADAAGSDDGSGRASLLDPPGAFDVNVSGTRDISINRL